MDADEFTHLKIRRADMLHKLGAILMWGSVPLALVNVYFMEAFLDWFMFNFLVCFVLALAGAVIKKRFCPQCRDE